MDNLLKDRLFYDFYKSLLTKHQQEILDLYYDEDLGLAEIAERLKTSRQAVYDLVKRSSRSLNSYEKKLHLVDNEINHEKLKDKIIQKLEVVLDDRTTSSESKELILDCIDELRGGL